MSGYNEVMFTVFTPIYNRKHTIYRVWDSLKSQTIKDFEWIIINDGSTDGVEVLLEEYKKNANFKVRIFSQKNSGKHIAFNKAIDEAKGKLLIPADSDDSFIPTTVEFFKEKWEKYGDISVSGIDVLCMDENGQIIGDVFPNDGISNFFDIFYKNKIKGEKWGCIRVDILREFKFPEMYGASFFPEGYVWSQIGMKYDTIYINMPLRVYYQDAGNQIMKDKNTSLGTIRIGNFYTIWWINTIYPRINSYISLQDVFKKFISLWRTSFFLNLSPLSVLEQIKPFKSKFIAIITYFPSFIYYKINHISL